MFYPKGWSERERGIELAQAAVFYDLPAINNELRARNSRRAKGSRPLPFLEDVDEADGRGCAGVDPVVETRALLDMIGGAEFLLKTPSRGRGRPLKRNTNMFIVAVMNRWMSLAPPKDKRRGRRRERMSFRREWQKHHTLNRPFPVPPRPGPALPFPWRFLPRVWTAWPVPKGDFAPKRRPSAIVATIVLAGGRRHRRTARRGSLRPSARDRRESLPALARGTVQAGPARRHEGDAHMAR